MHHARFRPPDYFNRVGIAACYRKARREYRKGTAQGGWWAGYYIAEAMELAWTASVRTRTQAYRMKGIWMAMMRGYRPIARPIVEEREVRV